MAIEICLKPDNISLKDGSTGGTGELSHEVGSSEIESNASFYLPTVGEIEHGLQQRGENYFNDGDFFQFGQSLSGEVSHKVVERTTEKIADENEDIVVPPSSSVEEGIGWTMTYDADDDDVKDIDCKAIDGKSKRHMSKKKCRKSSHKKKMEARVSFDNIMKSY